MTMQNVKELPQGSSLGPEAATWLDREMVKSKSGIFRFVNNSRVPLSLVVARIYASGDRLLFSAEGVVKEHEKHERENFIPIWCK